MQCVCSCAPYLRAPYLRAPFFEGGSQLVERVPHLRDQRVDLCVVRVERVEQSPQEIERVKFEPIDREIEVELAGPDGTVKAKVHYPSEEAQIEFQRSLEEQGIEFDSEGSGGSAFASLLFLLPLLVIVAFLIFVFRRMQGGNQAMMGIGKSKANRHTADMPGVKFTDVAGADEAVEELHEITEFLALGARIPKGLLLYGPPGTGKTLLARAVAGEAGVPFFSISGADFVEMFVSVGASWVRDLFNQAKQTEPAIIFNRPWRKSSTATATRSFAPKRTINSSRSSTTTCGAVIRTATRTTRASTCAASPRVSSLPPFRARRSHSSTTTF